MTWTKRKPTKPDWYWTRLHWLSEPPSVIHLDTKKIGYNYDKDREWSSTPIPQPKPKKARKK